MFGQGEQFKFGKWLGDEKANELIRLSSQVVKLSDYEMQEIIEHYKEKLADL